jgi:ethanolamine ammonia-lyase large subunit
MDILRQDDGGVRLGQGVPPLFRQALAQLK